MDCSIFSRRRNWSITCTSAASTTSWTTCAKTNRLARFTAAWQDKPLGPGHAVLQAREAVGNEPFAVILPDDIFDSERPCLRQLLDASEAKNARTVALMRVASREISKYGIVEVEPTCPRLYALRGMVEKPLIDEALGDFAIVDRYVLISSELQPAKVRLS